MVLRALIAAVLAALLLAPAVPADAAVTRKKAMWGPLEHNGFPQMPVYADLGVGIYQMDLSWADVAPTRPADPRSPADPAYRWPAQIDRAVEEGGAHGITVSLMVMWTPGWANGGREPRWAPTRPQDYADFLEAASRRYPGVRHWLIWGEPSKKQNFQPLSPDKGRPLRGRGLRGPRLYARMLDAAYASLKRVSRANRVIGGNTYTVGTVAPLRYMSALRLPDGRPPRMDLWGHNPFSLRKPNLDHPPLGDGLSDFSDLDQFVGSLDRNMRRARLKGQRRLKVFISEYVLPTDHPNFELNFYLDRKTQAEWITAALRIVRGFKRVYTFGYLGLYDDPPRPNGDQVERGLIQRDGARKPSYEAFKRG
jgi:hypothetical protein